jgi:ABC-type phosphonate transport system ATPase subunit
MNQPLLAIENLKVAYGPTEVLHGVSLEVHSGEIVTLIGSNGAGKTTLWGPARPGWTHRFPRRGHHRGAHASCGPSWPLARS